MGVREVMEEVIAEFSDQEEVKTVMEEAISKLTIKEEQTDIIRVLRDRPPAHYLFKIENFSKLSDAKVENFQSSDFEVGGYKWRLSLYPEGNKKKNEDNHLSLYLALSNSNGLPFHSSVNAFFKLFVYNQIQDKYLAVQDGKETERRFRGMKTEWGFDQFISRDAFNDASNGYLIDDCCVFGAEIYIMEECTGKGECMSIVKELANNTFTWNVQIELNRENYRSEVFDIGGHKWSLSLNLNGYGTARGKSLSVFLFSEDSDIKVDAEYILRVRDQLSEKHQEKKATHQFSTKSNNWGYSDLLPLRDLNDTSKGFIVGNTVIVEIQMLFMTVVKEFS
ncbi:TNF receptor-associated factor homolog 1a isoform X4 [Jatropha curcas]|uniref:TNF receptor-associated factor homolog 1a isoform X1 n=1 Tax=Jatropha curcas TaxID=180498 RepID=UPI0005FBD6EC|nr:TNF receptor-associated factor homolog 1a isoform X1 [Jatropha curcas]XP_020533137.1 TNF receptor-associated factor homolog 1a isoform X1 [Jatropha curcas]XP_037493616.1 TNF receptor-associated factor homolog 1a isoform X1 [Jatropha curcas]XP_037493617.1 TNF receptor-associated factor homolog 1a isoform X2 [Jatropha curcas]XP_037493618.1 TNF receptor-associated factor homolog 1a isoform X3 [Jatropha curcas]XP_037493619.1 TNF receptor-associated factor homolog 1a isoform X4 [Jatropha curcas]